MIEFVAPEHAQQVAGGKSNMTLWRWERDGLFPRRVKIGPNSTAYVREELEAWAEARKRERDAAIKGGAADAAA